MPALIEPKFTEAQAVRVRNIVSEYITQTQEEVPDLKLVSEKAALIELEDAIKEKS